MVHLDRKGSFMKRIFLSSLLLILSVPACATSFLGSYHCNGFDPYLNRKYSGTVKVEQQSAVYRITMTYDTGETYYATGGQYNDELLSVVFQDHSDLKVVGLEQYRWAPDNKSIGGFWVYLGKDKLGSEVCIKDEVEKKKQV